LTISKFARKEFNIDNDQKESPSALGHKKELKNLAILNHLGHPNIIELLGSYTYDGRHNLLFRLADKGNLAEFLAAERPIQFASDETLVIALAALSSAVAHVHDFAERKIDLELIGCHHDLRPRNILVSGSSFILADFGLSTFKPLSQNSETPFKPVNDDYLAPECEDWDNKFQAGTVHRSSDLWSFGCIIAEIATFMALGREGIEAFSQAREYKVRGFVLYQFHQGPKRASHVVETWLSKLETSSTRTCTLLVRIVRQILNMDESERPTAKEVTCQLRLVALYEISGTVHDLFHQIRNEGDSLDMFLEHKRFDAWRYAIGILNLKNEPNPQYKTSFDTLSQFDAILGCLVRFRSDLKLRLSQNGNAQSLNLSTLLKLNDELHCFLSREQHEIAREYFNVTVMEGDDELFERFDNRENSVALNHEIRMRANIKHVNNLLARGSGSESRTMKIEPSAVELGDRFGDHCLGRFNNGQISRPVWVEWRRYGQHGAEENTMENLYGRAARIAELLSQEKPEAFRTLQCSGFFHDPARAAFGVVFKIPQSTAPEGFPEPTGLHQVIEATTGRSSSWPALDDRFKLASSLATSLLQLHTVGWFHKSLNTSNVIFFPEKVGAQGQSIQEPFLVGFNHSRPNEPLAFTSGIADSDSKHYQHPAYLKGGSGYRPEFDYYSLGIILMEIGFWLPFSQITRSWTGSYEDRRRKLLGDRVPQLRQRMGREYYEAVRCCIQCDFGGSEFGNPGGKDVLLQFRERVVARLHGCFV
jgi:serine/threonine protein kinase